MFLLFSNKAKLVKHRFTLKLHFSDLHSAASYFTWSNIVVLRCLVSSNDNALLFESPKKKQLRLRSGLVRKFYFKLFWYLCRTIYKVVALDIYYNKAKDVLMYLNESSVWTNTLCHNKITYWSLNSNLLRFLYALQTEVLFVALSFLNIQEQT